MSTIEKLWKRILKDIHEKGSIHNKDDAEIKEILNISGWIDSPIQNNDAVFVGSKMFVDLVRAGLYDIPEYNIKGDALADYVDSINDKEKIHLDYNDSSAFVYTYPERLKAMPVSDKYDNFMVDTKNQIDIMINRLLENSGSNRAVATLYNCGMDSFVDDIPCLNWVQALIRDDRLYLAVMFRSNDIYNAFPSNMMLLMNIGLIIVESLRFRYPNLSFHGVYYNCTSAHYYTSAVDDEIIKEIIYDN